MQDKPTSIYKKQVSSKPTPNKSQSSLRHYVSSQQHPDSPRERDNSPSQHSKCFLMLIPDESLANITTFIDDPQSLFALSRVNCRLRDHVADDNTWRSVFAFHFLGVEPEHDPVDEQRLLLRRTESTWKKEYVRRFNLTRRWERSRNSTLSYQPQYSNISSVHLLENVSLLTSNVQYGIVTRSFPLTGKILKGHLDASGTTNGLGIGNPNAEFSPNVSCITLSSCGGTGRVAWGFRNGEVATTFAPRVMDSNHSAARFVRCSVAEEHTAEVRCALFVGKDDALVVTGCRHGEVKLWDAKRMRCLWASKADTVVPDSCMNVAFCGSAGALVAAMEGGDIVLWWGFQLGEDTPLVDNIRQLRVPGVGHKVFMDPNSSSESVRILAHHKGDRDFLGLTVDLESGLVARTRFAGGPLGPLTSLRPCFATSVPLAPVPPTPKSTDTPALTIVPVTKLDVFQERSFVLAGDTLGRVCVWDWDGGGSFDPTTKGSDEIPQVNAVRKWEAHEDGAVCAIEISDAVIVTGSTHGSLKVWDSLTLTLLRTFASPASKPSVTGEWDPVGQIIIREDLLVTSVGSRILVWQAGVVAAEKKGKGKHTPKAKGRAITNKWQQQIELNRDIRESQRQLEDERARTQRVYSREKAQLSTLDQLGLDEREAVEYLLMLSRDEEEERRASELVLGPPNGLDDEFVPEAATLANSDDLDGVFPLDEHTGPTQAAPMGFNHWSPTLSPSSGRTSISSSPSRSIPRAMPSHFNHKVQVSPLFLPEPTEAGLSTSPLLLAETRPGPTPISSVRRQDSGVSTSLSSMSTSLLSDSDAEQFPRIGSSTSTPSRSTSSLQLAGSWTGGSPARRGGSAWTGSDTQASHPSTPSSWSLSGNGTGISREEEMDAELRYVLELSLAEARSRGEV